MTARAPNIRRELVEPREVTEVIIVSQEKEAEETETGEAVTHSNLKAEVSTTHPIVFIAVREAISVSVEK